VKLNEEQIREVLGEAETAVFGIDGQVIDRWTLQENGEWRGRRDLPCQRAGSKPNLRPGLLTVSSEGELLKEIDLRELGMGAPLMVFDLKPRYAGGFVVEARPRPGLRVGVRRGPEHTRCDAEL
jgi:hypothetical protein